MNIKKLFEIIMSSITLPEFPSGFAGAWSSIVNLDIRKGTFIKQTVQLTAFPVLESVVFNNNQIELEMVYLPNLNTLHATDCGMDTFPDLSRAPKLELAQLNKNNFTEIPQFAIVGLTKLTKFMFIGCRVRYLPDLSHLVSLQILKAHTNYLMSFPDLYHLPLTTLTLSNNPICYVTNHCAGYECGTVLNEQSRCLMSTVVTHTSIWGLHWWTSIQRTCTATKVTSVLTIYYFYFTLLMHTESTRCIAFKGICSNALIKSFSQHLSENTYLWQRLLC